MKKLVLLAGLLLVGAACSKNDEVKQDSTDDGGQGKVTTPVAEAPAVYPTEKQGDDQNYRTTTYELDGKKVKKVVEETYQDGQKRDDNTTVTEVTYTDKKYPTKLVETTNGNTRQLEYTYDNKNRVTAMELTQGTNKEKRTFEYDEKGRVTKEIHTQPGVEPITTVYTYPDDKTVVEKNPSDPNRTKVYTFENGNLVKSTYEWKDANGQVMISETYTYKYDTTIKNPEASLERQLVSLNYFYNPLFFERNSKNVVTERVFEGVDHTIPLQPRTTTYTYEKNDKGYPTKVTEKGQGYETVTVLTY